MCFSLQHHLPSSLQYCVSNTGVPVNRLSGWNVKFNLKLRCSIGTRHLTYRFQISDENWLKGLQGTNNTVLHHGHNHHHSLTRSTEALNLNSLFVPGVANDEAAEHCSDSSSWAGHTHCGSTSADELSSSVNVPGDRTGLEGAGQHCRLADWQQSLGEETNTVHKHIYKQCSPCLRTKN